jgi:cytosine/adenosine deaminase-related metal-dependent hydrolase
MKPHDVIVAATTTAAANLKLTVDNIGTVAKHYLADLIIVDGDPLERGLENLRNSLYVIRDGQKVVDVGKVVQTVVEKAQAVRVSPTARLSGTHCVPRHRLPRK